MIRIVPIGAVDQEHLRVLIRSLPARFRQPVRLHQVSVNVNSFLDQRRRQFHSSAILKFLFDFHPNLECKVLGVTEVDLFIPILTYVFGEAQLQGSCAVISSYRLDPVRYGLPPSPQVLNDRLLKEAVHELGHTYGLIHCNLPDCVMYSSVYAADIDSKSADFCVGCRAILRDALKRECPESKSFQVPSSEAGTERGRFKLFNKKRQIEPGELRDCSESLEPL